MTQEQISNWEKENQHKIIGWESQYGYKDKETKEWIWFKGFKRIVFKMIDDTEVEFEMPV